MQQTEKYKLNLIETSDPFSPNALNENTQKLEDAILAHKETVASQVEGLDQRVKVFEAKKLAYGTCTGALNSSNTVELGFTPIMVIIHHCRGSDGATALAVAGQAANSGLDILESGFKFDIGDGMNIRAGLYTYLAFG